MLRERVPSLPVGGELITREWEPPWPLDIVRTLSALRMGRRDPCHQLAADGALWRTSLMDSGPVTYRLARRGPVVVASAWGAGAAEMLDGLEDLLGAADHPESFQPDHPFLDEAVRRLAGLRVPRTGRVMESLIAAILHQKISGRDATASWAWLVRRHGCPAPGPRADAPSVLSVPPAAEVWAAVPDWDWRQAGVEPSAARTIRLVASRAATLERLGADASPADFYPALTSLPGVGRWTAAEVGHRALGDADALSVGDYHIASLTGWALAGRELADDEVEPFYERWRPHRYRVMRLLELTPSAWPPRRGARMSRPLHRYGV